GQWWLAPSAKGRNYRSRRKDCVRPTRPTPPPSTVPTNTAPMPPMRTPSRVPAAPAADAAGYPMSNPLRAALRRVGSCGRQLATQTREPQQSAAEQPRRGRQGNRAARDCEIIDPVGTGGGHRAAVLGDRAPLDETKIDG